MKIAGFQKISTIDFPGKLSAVVFTQGCNFNCTYCHNKEILKDSAKLLDEEEVFSFLKLRRSFLKGLVITGGEPTLQKDLPEFIKKVREWGYRIKLDTNGSDISVVENLVGNQMIDYLAVDLKVPDFFHQEICGNKSVRENIKRLTDTLSEKTEIEVRTTVLPLMTANYFVHMAKDFLVKALRDEIIYSLQPLRDEKGEVVKESVDIIKRLKEEFPFVWAKI